MASSAPGRATTPDAVSPAEKEFYDRQRRELLDRLLRVMPSTSASAWACLWLSDITEIKCFIRVTESLAAESSGAESSDAESSDAEFSDAEFSDRNRTLLELQLGHPDIAGILSTWLSKTRNMQQSTASTPVASAFGSMPATPSSSRNTKRNLDEIRISNESPTLCRKPVAECKERDNEACVLTKDGEYEIAHLYPFSLRTALPNDPERNKFWRLLRIFWSTRRVRSWEQAVFPDGDYKDACYNMISLSPSARRYFDKAYFGLKPVSLSTDKKQFDVQFFWLGRGNPQALQSLDSRPSLDLAGDVGPTRSRLWNHETGDPIRSGDIITLKTHDPSSCPLPKWEILEMQWFLQRAAAISGAAEMHDDDEIGVLASDVEMEDDSDYVDIKKE